MGGAVVATSPPVPWGHLRGWGEINFDVMRAFMDRVPEGSVIDVFTWKDPGEPHRELVSVVIRSASGEPIVLKEPKVDFPSETLLAQVMLVAG